MGRMGIYVIFTIFLLVLDVYTYFGMKQIVQNDVFSKIFPWLYVVISLIGYYSLSQMISSLNSGPFGSRTELLNLMIGFVFTLFVTKLTFSILLGMQDLGRLLAGAFNVSRSMISDDPQPDNYIPGRRDFLTTATTVIAGIPFLTMLYGITKGKYNYTVEKLTLTFKELPKAFDGFRLVQISDIHSGSFDNPDRVKAGVAMINELQGDVVCFTGDLVNSEKEEIDPYIEIFGAIRAKHGKYAIMGNHDYYGSYDEDNAKAYFDDFDLKFQKMGFELLKNSNRKITVGQESINLVGVENWGAGRWFPKKGDLDVATLNLPRNGFNILMSHDPSHWDAKVLQHGSHMHLTLSGHTHGFQFGFQLPGFKWSPAQYRYPRWLGLYKENDKYLYVNRGFGFLGFPGRIGMWPEITLIELRSA
jgi:uncharacterized protein